MVDRIADSLSDTHKLRLENFCYSGELKLTFRISKIYPKGDIQPGVGTVWLLRIILQFTS